MIELSLATRIPLRYLEAESEQVILTYVDILESRQRG